MDSDFVVQVECTKFSLNGGLRVYLNLFSTYFPKSTSEDLFSAELARKHGFRCITVICGCYVFLKVVFWVVKPLILFQTNITKCIVGIFFLQHWVLHNWSGFETKVLQNRFFVLKKKYWGKKGTERYFFGKIWRIIIQICPQTSIKKNMVHFTWTTMSGSMD